MGDKVIYHAKLEGFDLYLGEKVKETYLSLIFGGLKSVFLQRYKQMLYLVKTFHNIKFVNTD